MRCVIRRQGETQVGTATVTLERNGTTLDFKRAPASVCTNCGKGYVDEETTTRLLESAEAEAGAGVEEHIHGYMDA